MNAHGGNFRRDLQLHYLFSQQAHRPPGSTVGCWRARKGGQASVKGTVKAKPGGLGAGFALQRGFDALFYKSFFEMFDGARGNAQCFRHVGDLLGTAVRSGIAQQQCAGMNKSVSCCLARARQFFQPAALILAECNAITGCHALSFTKKHPTSICEIQDVTWY